MAVVARRSIEPQAAREKRITVLTAVIFLFGSIILIRLFSLEVLNNAFYSLMASERHEVYRNLFPNRDYYLVYAEPTKITSPNTVVDALTPILGLEEDEWKALLPKLADDTDPY